MTATYSDRIRGVETAQAIKHPVIVATTADITLSGEQTIDGVAVVAGNRVLVKDQSTATENGIYTAATSAWSRSLDFNGARDVAEGTVVVVSQGTTQGGLLYRLTTASPVIGTSSLAFEAISELGLSVGVNVQAQNASLQALADETITGVSGSDPDVVTGTAGTSGHLAKWNADGDLVDASTGYLITEGASVPVSPTAGLSTWWVKSDAPNVPMFTDDTAVDWVLGYAESNHILAFTSNGSGTTSLSWLDMQLTRFNRWVYDIDFLAVTVDGNSPVMQFSPDGGTTWRDTASTDYEGWSVTGGTVTGRTATGVSGAPLCASGVGNASNEFGVSGTITVMGAESATQRTRFEIRTQYRKTTGAIETFFISGECLTVEAHNAVRVRDSGGLASGQIRWQGRVA